MMKFLSPPFSSLSGLQSCFGHSTCPSCRINIQCMWTTPSLSLGKQSKAGREVEVSSTPMVQRTATTLTSGSTELTSRSSYNARNKGRLIWMPDPGALSLSRLCQSHTLPAPVSCSACELSADRVLKPGEIHCSIVLLFSVQSFTRMEESRAAYRKSWELLAGCMCAGSSPHSGLPSGN